MSALAARYATEFNVAFASVEAFNQRKQLVEAACAVIERDQPIRYSAALTVCAGATEADITRRAAAIGKPPESLRRDGAAGSAQETAATIRRYVDAGAERFYLQILDLSDLDHLDFLAGEVAPLLT